VKKLDAACASGDGGEEADGEEDEDASTIPIPPVGAAVKVLKGFPTPGQTELFEFEEGKVAVVDGDSFRTDESSAMVYSAGDFDHTWKVGAPVVGAAVQLADQTKESGWADHTVLSVTLAGKTFKVAGGESTPITVSKYGNSWRYVPVAKPAAPAAPAATSAANGKRSLVAAASTVAIDDDDDVLDRAKRVCAAAESGQRKRRNERIGEIRKSLDDELDVEDEEYSTKLVDHLARATEQAQKEIPPDPKVVELTNASDKLAAAQRAVDEARGELVALIDSVEGTSSASAPPSAKRARK